MRFDIDSLREAAAVIRSKNTIANKYDDAGSKLAGFVQAMTDETKADEAFFRAEGFEEADSTDSSTEWAYVLSKETASGVCLTVTGFKDGWIVLEDHPSGKRLSVEINNPTKGDVARLVFCLSQGGAP
jgi:hypothetical protein